MRADLLVEAQLDCRVVRHGERDLVGAGLLEDVADAWTLGLGRRRRNPTPGG